MGFKKQAMVFAAGLGSRLRPLTDNIPKVLVKVNGKEIISIVIDKLLAAGFEKIVINTHYFADMVESFVVDNYPNSDISIVFEPEILETGGGLLNAAHLFDDGPILIYNGDILSDLDINDLWQAHIKHNALVTLACFDRDSDRKFLWNSEQHLCGWINEKTSEVIWSKKVDTYTAEAFAAIHVIEAKALEIMGPVRKFSITPSYLELSKNQRIIKYKASPSYWFDIGSVEKLNEASQYLRNLETIG